MRAVRARVKRADRTVWLVDLDASHAATVAGMVGSHVFVQRIPPVPNATPNDYANTIRALIPSNPEIALLPFSTNNSAELESAINELRLRAVVIRSAPEGCDTGYLLVGTNRIPAAHPTTSADVGEWGSRVASLWGRLPKCSTPEQRALVGNRYMGLPEEAWGCATCDRNVCRALKCVWGGGFCHPHR